MSKHLALLAFLLLTILAPTLGKMQPIISDETKEVDDGITKSLMQEVANERLKLIAPYYYYYK